MPLTVVQTGVGGTGQTTALIPSGTAMLFQQTAAPTGWTKITSSDNAALRIVSGAASTGGSVNFTTAFASQAVTGSVANTGATTATNNSYTPAGSVSTTVGSTTLSTSQIPSHNHTFVQDTAGLNQGTIGIGGSDFCRSLYYRDAADTSGLQWGTNFTGSSGSHNHTGSSSFSGTPATITQASHTHTSGAFTGNAINLAVKYVDAIIATKD